MKVIIAGSRHIKEYEIVFKAIKESGFEITEVVSGKAPGVDKAGELWADKNGCEVTSFPANWDKYGKPAGPIRNSEMAKYADALIAIWDGKSTGTEDMIKKAKTKGLKVYIHYV